ncbi:acyl carrier protein [Actinomadura madurae]|uniref:acyl carrier protein n=1 Tax=Actinomadura madurae TaxID=1993 RepID=UPI002025C380|nr:acyl carrier protein [Actinomadura madurae]URM96806.1 acyl carrier protein [Actinomadura madurae]
MSDGFQDRDEALSNNDASNEGTLVRELIRKLVAEIAPPDSPEVRPGHLLRDELGYDSVREVELTFALEELFEFEPFVVEDAPQLETVGELEDFTLDMIAQGRATVPASAAAPTSTTAPTAARPR